MHMPDDLSLAEQKVVAKAKTGEEAIFGEPTPEELADPALMPVVRAAVIRALCLGEWEDVRVHAKGVKIAGARIPEPLDFEFATLLCPLTLSKCRLDDTVLLSYVTAKFIDFSGSHAEKGIDADGADIKGDVVLTDGFTAKRKVSLINAKIGGSLNLKGANLDNTNDADQKTGHIILLADGADIKGSMFLGDKFTTKGQIRLLGASIGGDLSLSAANLSRIENINIRDNFAFWADKVNIKGSMNLRRGFKAEGEVRLNSASIGADLDMTTATLNSSDDYCALSADSVKVTGSVLLRGECIANGEVKRFKRFIANGEVNLSSAKIDDSLFIVNATFNVACRNKSKTAVSFKSATVGNQLYLHKTCTTGFMDLKHCRVRELDDDRDSWPAAGCLHLDGFIYDSFGSTALRTVKERKEWLQRQYPKPCTVKQRLLDLDWWLLQQRCTGAFWPQPYEQLIRVFRAMGYDTEARKVAIAKQDDQRTYGQLNCSRWLLSWLLTILVAHGYKPGRGLWYLCGLILFGWGVFGWADSNSVMVPTSHNYQRIEQSDRLTGYLSPELGTEYPRFSPFIYSVQLSVPILDLQQVKAWIPSPRGDWSQYRKDWLVLIWMRIHIFLGWVFTTVTVAAFTASIIRKD